MRPSNNGGSKRPPIQDFYNRHSGETCVLVGNGPNLELTPLELLNYPTFGMNTCFKRTGWKPDYYTVVDSRVMREFGEEVLVGYADVPKFFPTPNLDKWEGPNIYRFYHRPGPLWPRCEVALWPPGLLTEQGITYGNVMHIAMQLAYYMGFKTMLIVGMQHRPNHAKEHFWGVDEGMHEGAPVKDWIRGYKVLVDGMGKAGTKVLNISADTYVPDKIIPRDDWRNWIKEK